MAEPIRWGVLGNSTIGGRCVIPAIEKSSNGRVYALASRTPDRAEAMVCRYNIDRLYGAYEALLDDDGVDAVYIPLPNHLHHPWTMMALQAGKHVLCEKPMACNADQAREMAEAADAAGLLLMEAFMYRFHPRSRKIRELITRGAIGRVHLVRAAFCYLMDPETLKAGENARLKPETGGGALLDVGSYCVSVARWLTGAEPAKVQAQAVYNEHGADLQVAGTLFFPANTLAVFEASFISTLQQTYSVMGDRGGIELPHDAFIPWEKDAEFTVRAKDQEKGVTHVAPGADEYLLMVERFAEIVLGAGEPDLTSKDSILNMRALDAIADAARTGATVHL